MWNSQRNIGKSRRQYQARAGCCYFRRKYIRTCKRRSRKRAEAEIPKTEPTETPETEPTETKPTDKPEKSTAEKKQPIILKDLGEGIEEANILKVAVKKGDEIKEGTILIELETDKSTIEIPSDFAGKVESIAIKEGDKIKTGQEILTISIVSSETTPAKEEPTAEEPTAKKPQKKNL